MIVSVSHVKHVSPLGPGCNWSAVDIGRDFVVQRSRYSGDLIVFHWSDLATVNNDVAVVESGTRVAAVDLGKCLVDEVLDWRISCAVVPVICEEELKITIALATAFRIAD